MIEKIVFIRTIKILLVLWLHCFILIVLLSLFKLETSNLCLGCLVNHIFMNELALLNILITAFMQPLKIVNH